MLSAKKHTDPSEQTFSLFTRVLTKNNTAALNVETVSKGIQLLHCVAICSEGKTLNILPKKKELTAKTFWEFFSQKNELQTED